MNALNVKNRVMAFSAAILLASSAAFGQAPQKFDMTQTLSDGAQNHQIAFDGLGFLSGDFCACTFVPPGKVADYFGFQYMRDNDITFMGHNSDFGGVIANNLLSVLTTDQKNQIAAMAKSQVAIIKQYAMMRFPLMDAFVRMRDSSMPAGSQGLDIEAIKTYSAKLYRVDGRVCLQRAQLYASIINSFTAVQKHFIDSISKIGMKNMTVLPDQIDKRGMTNNEFVGVMSIADDIYSWYVGNVEADVYFCPERQGNYFGSFYLKDAPAMGNPNYSIDTSLSQSGGARFLKALTSSQQKLVTSLLDIQRSPMTTLVSKRTEISNLLRGYLSNKTVDTTAILSLSEDYGKLDGEISYHYATNFSKVNWTLSSAQKDTLIKIRNLDNYPCSGAYLYSDKITLPTFENTDYMFLKSTTSLTDPARATGCYPNPFTNTIIVNNTNGEERYTLSNNAGQTMWTGQNIEKHDFSALPKGFYLLKIEKGSSIETFKMMK